YPSSQIHIKFEPAAEKKPTEEQVYEVLRRYGQLDELTASGDGYTARFRYVSGGVAARNCLHRAPLQLEGQDGPVTTFCIEYKQFVQKWLWETLTANARFVFPLFVVFMFGTTYFIWDPMRTAFVHLRLAAIFSSVPSRSDSEHREGDSHYAGATGLLLRGLQGALRGLREARAVKSSREGLFDDFWSERKSEITELQDWLDQPPERVMLLTGHRGNGLNEMARKLAGHRVLEINVRDMLEVGGAADDHLFLRSFSRSVGYWPAQGMDRQLSAVLDLMLPGSGKQLSRESELLVAVQRVLFAMTQALHTWRLRSIGALNFDATPLILITGFTSENKDRRPGFFEALVSWAAYVSEAKLARVVFVADSSFGEPSILSHLK
ncbi:YME2, partial [Symbiodinium sp. CCMP2456]